MILDHHRIVYDVPLQPVLGSAFQPTGFPDIGAATFERFVDGSDQTMPSLLVESVQSMANRLEAAAWSEANQQPVDVFDGMPYVRVVRDDADEGVLTSSRLEAHRLASPFVFEATLDGQKMMTVINERLGLRKDTPLDYRNMAQALMQLDPFCLVHGVFFARREWLGQPRFTRAVSAVIEAHDVERLSYGGRKSDRVRHQLDESSGGTAEGYGSVPFQRTEWTARSITASYAVDVTQLRGYGLPDPATELLATTALWEIRAMLDGGLRLRTACDLEVAGDIVVRHGDPLPTLDQLSERVTTLIAQSGSALGDGKPITVRWKSK
jgi:CRISPR-associated protein Csb1